MAEHQYGKASLRRTMSPVDQRMAQDIAVPYTDAIRVAEGNPNYGVQGHDNNPRQTTLNSVVNNVARWQATGSPGKFVDFMAHRWAPVGSNTDKPDPTRPGHTLNENWPGNVRKALQKNPNVDYQFLKDQNLVRAPLDQFQVVA